MNPFAIKMLLLLILTQAAALSTTAETCSTAGHSYLSSFDKFSLTYFDGRGLAEVPRTLFATAGRLPSNGGFKDQRLSRDEFNKLKGTGDFLKNLNRVPILNHNGNVIGQSSAIARYLAKEFHMYGTDKNEAAQIDSICEHIVDIRSAFRKVFPYKVEFSEEEKSTKNSLWFRTPSKPELEGRKNRQLQWLLAQLETMLPGDGYSVGGRPSLADADLYNLLGEEAPELGEKGEGWMNNRSLTDFVLAMYPNILAIVERFKESPGMQQWLAERGEMKF